MPAKIVLTKGQKAVQQFVLTNESTVIGRRPDTDIPIDDPAVSGVHAKVQIIGNSYLVQDLNSTNGIHIGGRKVKQQVLQDGDVVVIGEHALRFIHEDSDKGEPAEAKASTTDEPVQVDATEIRTLPPKPAPGAGAAVSVLMVLDGPDKDKLIKLTEALTTIGTPGVQVAAISTRPQGHFIIHVDGGKDKARVPFVNGEPTGFKSRKLEHGDKIEVADITMEYLSP